MKRNSFLWGLLIILVGVVLLSVNLGFVTASIWKFIWPGFLVLLGVWFILGPRLWKSSFETTTLSIPRENAPEAEITFNYSAGRLSIDASANPNEIIAGTFEGGISSKIDRSGDTARVKLNTPEQVVFPGYFWANRGLDWTIGLTPDIPLKLIFHTGACEAKLNLSDLKVTELTLETGASATEITLPANAGLTRVSIKSGAASVKIRVPDGVAASIRESSGLSGINIDTNRFPQNGHTYQSSDFATSINQAEILFEGGVGSIQIN